MPYITSVERLGIEKGLQQGRQEGRQCDRFPKMRQRPKNLILVILALARLPQKKRVLYYIL